MITTTMTIVMTLEHSKEPSLCLLTHTAVDHVLLNQLHPREFKEWCPLLLVDTTVRLTEELLQDH
jgi:hypothetical protein